MRVTLAYPPFLLERVHTENIDPPPMGVFYIGAMLMEHGHEVHIANLHQAGQYPELMERVLLENSPDVLGISIFHANRFGGIELAACSKRLFPNVPVVMGGIGATFLDELLLTHFPDIDAVVRGEGELTFLELIEAVARGLPPSHWRDIAGLGLRDAQGRFVRTRERPLIADLDALPNPARYFTFQHLALTRGCPGKCHFCGSPRFWGSKVRSHSAAYFVEQMALLHEKGVNFFYVSDDTFTVNKRRVIDICREIVSRELRITWAAISRVDAVNAEVLSWMRRAGCIQISYGVESGSPRIRRALGKNTRQEDMEQAFAQTTAQGILARAYFIYGCPGEDAHSLSENIACIKALKPLIALFHILAVFPGTRLWEDIQEQYGLTDAVWLQRIEDILWFQVDANLNQDTVLEYGKKLKTAYFSNLAAFALQVKLADTPELLPEQADFLSRLGMTFQYGDYATNPLVQDKEATAEALYRRSLALAPDRRALMGLASLLQRRAGHDEALELLAWGRAQFPQDTELVECSAASLMELGRLRQALDFLSPLTSSARAMSMAAQCCQALGDASGAEAFRKRYRALP